MPDRFAIPIAVLLAAAGVRAGGPASPAEAPAGGGRPDTSAEEDRAREFEEDVVPLLDRYCYRCHGAGRTEAELDLAAAGTWDLAREELGTWQRVREMLESGRMPPRKARQPADEERSRLEGWVRAFLREEAKALAGDPGPVVLRRLSRREYTYTVRDLTGVDSLDPAREFPVDGAAGEGFTNTGDALGMSPALFAKYLGGAKDVARHLVLLPDGIRFSPHVSRRDRTDAALARLRDFYSRYTVDRGASAVDLQGIRFGTNRGGRLPFERYVRATLAERDALARGEATIASVAAERGLNAKYLGKLWSALAADGGPVDARSFLLARIRRLWRAAGEGDAGAELVREIRAWQEALWTFRPVGYIGVPGHPTRWMEPVSPLRASEEFRRELPDEPRGESVELHLVAGDAGDGNATDYVVWKTPRLTGAGRPDLLLRDVAATARRFAEARRQALSKTSGYLAAASRVAAGDGTAGELAARAGLDAGVLRAWCDYLGTGSEREGPVEVDGLFASPVPENDEYGFIRGWGRAGTPSVVANSSGREVRIPGIAPPGAVLLHPSPELFVAAGWRSPIAGRVTVEARVGDAHPECGNGVEYVLEHRSFDGAEVIWRGDFGSRGEASLPPRGIEVRPGEMLSLLVGPREGNHVCDLTEVRLELREAGDGASRQWSLSGDVSPDILAGNPHADRHGNDAVWHFYAGEPASLGGGAGGGRRVPAGSLLADWQVEEAADERLELARRVEALVLGELPVEEGSADARLREGVLAFVTRAVEARALSVEVAPGERFGRHPLGGVEVRGADLVTRAPSVVSFRVPAALAAGRRLVVTGALEPDRGHEGTAQLDVAVGARPGPRLRAGRPVTASEGSEARKRVEEAFEAFRRLFPAALCYTRIVPVDEVVTLVLFHREDEPLRRLFLDEEESARLDRLWDELRFVSREPIASTVAYEQLVEFATQDNPALVKALEPLRKPILQRAGAFRRRLVELEPVHLDAVIDFAGRAWRRPLAREETAGLRRFYRDLRSDGFEHAEALRLTVARILSSPGFLYRLEEPAPGASPGPVSAHELASRLSYFLWSSMPDAELRALAGSGRLLEEEILIDQLRRMLRDGKVRRLAVEFACQWLHIRDFDRNDGKNERLYPGFAELRDPMYEEVVRFFEDLFRSGGSLLDIWSADHTFLDARLARFYGIEGVEGEEWRRVDGVRSAGRGGILTMAAVLAKQSGASRTSPILRGNWVYETLLGERLPDPPPDVPDLPDRVPEGRTARELIELHSSAPECASCHARIDPYGFALEGYDAIGRRREGPVDTRTELPTGETVEGVDGLREYLVGARREDVVRQFCRKLLGFALGRAVRLSDEPLLDEIMERLAENGYRVTAVFEAIVTSPQFRQIRGREAAGE